MLDWVAWGLGHHCDRSHAMPVAENHRGADEGDELINVLLVGLGSAGDLSHDGEALLIHSHALAGHRDIHGERRQTARPNLFAIRQTNPSAPMLACPWGAKRIAP